jgi:hypothetical protein
MSHSEDEFVEDSGVLGPKEFHEDPTRVLGQMDGTALIMGLYCYRTEA